MRVVAVGPHVVASVRLVSKQEGVVLAWLAGWSDVGAIVVRVVAVGPHVIASVRLVSK
jgi:hypothetical protein